MFRRHLLLALALLLLAVPAWSEPQSYDLLLMRRTYFANSLWSSELARLGGQEVTGSIVGLGGEHDAVMVYELGGKFEMLETLVGYMDSAPDNRSAVFEVWADGALVQRMGPLNSGQPPELMRVPVAGRRMMTMRIVPQRYDSTHGAAWGAPKLWANLEGTLPGGLLLNVDGQSSQAVATKRNGRQEVSIPLPLQSGVREYRVRMEFDPASGKVQVQTTEAAPAGEPGP